MQRTQVYAQNMPYKTLLFFFSLGVLLQVIPLCAEQAADALGQAWVELCIDSR